MVTIAEAKESVTQAEQALAEEEKKVEEYEKQVQAIETPRRNIAFQLGNRVVPGRTEQIVRERKRAKVQGIQEVKQAREQLSTYQQEIQQVKGEIQTAEAEEAAYYQEQEEWRIAQSYANKLTYPTYEPSGIRRKYEQIISGYTDYQNLQQATANLSTGAISSEQFKSMYPGVPIYSVTDIPKSTLPETLQYSEFTPTKKLNLGEKISDFIFKETNISRKFIGIGIPGTPLFLSASSVKERLEKTNLAGRTASILVPTTPFSVALTAATPVALKFAPSAIRIGAEVAFAYSGIKAALDKTLKPEERIIGGIVGGISVTGLAIEASPYIKGTLARFSPKFRAVEEVEGVKVIKDVPSKESFDINLIPSGSPLGTGKSTKGIPAYIKGGFGFSKEEQMAYVGKTGQITTSARDLLSSFKDEVKIDVSKDPLGLYATPFPIKEPGVAQTRISRLGLLNVKDLFSFPGKEAKFKLFPENPQIVVFEQAKITKIGGGGTFRALGNPSSELEVTATGVIKSWRKVGVTSISGQKVDIFSATLGKGGTSISLSESLSGQKGFNLYSTRGIQTIPTTSPVSITTGFAVFSSRVSEKTQPISSTSSYSVYPTKYTSYVSSIKYKEKYKPSIISTKKYKEATIKKTKYPKKTKTEIPTLTIMRKEFRRKEKQDKRKSKFISLAPKFSDKPKIKGIRPKQPIRYTPSLSATILRIKAKKIPKTIAGKKSYFFGFRPVITKIKKNKKSTKNVI